MLKHIQVCLASVLLYLLFVGMYSTPLADYDLWGYLAFGRAFWETGHFPYGDLFSYTPTKSPWVYHEWLTGVLFYPIYRSAGDAGLQLLRYLLILATLCLVYLTALRRGGTPPFAAIALVPAMLLICFGYVPVRAQIFTYLFFMLTLLVLEHFRMSQRSVFLLWLPPILVLWCNFHGGFVAGLGLVGLYALGQVLAGRRLIPIVAAGILASAATAINPYGLQYWHFILSALSMSRPDIREWVSVTGAIGQGIYLLPAYLFLIMSLLCLFACLLRRPKVLSDIIVAAVVILVGISHIRHTVFLGLVFGAFLPVVLAEHWRSLRSRFPSLQTCSWIPGAVLVCLGLLILLQVSAWRLPSVVPSFRLVTPESRYPLGAIDWMARRGARGNLLPYFDWGQYLLWQFHPDVRVAMDGRYETVYQDAVHREYFDFLLARDGWRVFLEKYPHEMILLRSGIPITALMMQEKDWQIGYRDRVSVLFIRNRPSLLRPGD